MKAIQSLLAVSILAATGVVNAAVVATFNVSVDGTINSPPPQEATGTVTGIGTATLDDSGILTLYTDATTDMVLFGSVPAVATLNTTTTYSGTLTGNSLAWTTGTNVLNSCTPGANGGLICANVTLDTPAPAGMDENPMIFDLTLGGITILHDTGSATAPVTYTLTTMSAVPVPAAAWLFGSGLIGIAGVARRRRAA